MDEDREYLTAAEVAARLGVSVDTIARWCTAGLFRGAYKLNPSARNSPFRIPLAAVRAFEAHQREASF